MSIELTKQYDKILKKLRKAKKRKASGKPGAYQSFNLREQDKAAFVLTHGKPLNRN